VLACPFWTNLGTNVAGFRARADPNFFCVELGRIRAEDGGAPVLSVIIPVPSLLISVPALLRISLVQFVVRKLSTLTLADRVLPRFRSA
jgi:hypothetical protein